MTRERHEVFIEIDISTKKHPNVKAIIDAADLPLVDGMKWTPQNGYAVRIVADATGKQRAIYMHRLIAGAEEGQIVDHLDRNRLNNRRSNLRIVDRTVNRLNTTPKAGVLKGFSRKEDGSLQVRVYLAGKCYQGGRYRDKIEAAMAYDRLARQVHGKEAVVNFPCALIGEPMPLADPKPIKR